jgi:alpha-tubulin suppressor-like RCC1 family protein
MEDKPNDTPQSLGQTALRVHYCYPDTPESVDSQTTHVYQVSGEKGFGHFPRANHLINIILIAIPIILLVLYPIGNVILGMMIEASNQAIFAVEGEAGTTIYSGAKIDVGTAAAINIGAGASTKYVKVSVGGAHTLALDDAGDLYAWGSDQYGQIGDGVSGAAHSEDCATDDCVVSPVNITNITGVDYPNFLYQRKIVDISAGATHSMAVDEDGNLYIWGDDHDGAVGDGSATLNHYGDLVLAPVKIDLVDPASKIRRRVATISAAAHFSTAIDDLGNLYSWGINLDNELGNNTNFTAYSPKSLTRERANPLFNKKINQVAASHSHAVATDDSGKTYTWGTTNYVMPVPIETNVAEVDLTDIETDDPEIISKLNITKKSLRQLSVSDDNTAVVTKTGELYSWGDNTNSQIGNECSTYMPTPIKLNGLATENIPCNSVLVAPNAAVAAPRTTSSSDDDPLFLLRYLLTTTGAITIDSITPSSGSVDGDTEVTIRGSGFVAGHTKITKVSANYHQSMAIDDEGNLYMWGRDEHGEIGDGTATGSSNVTTPTKITGVENGDANAITANTKIKDIAAGTYFSLAVDTAGKLYAWGFNHKGQLGIGTSPSKCSSYECARAPVMVTGKGALDSNVVITSIAAGWEHALALDNNGNVYTWGSNNHGQLGIGASSPTTCTSNTPCSRTPLKVTGGFKSIAPGGYFSLAINSGDRLYVWGENSSGQLGDGTTGDKNTPTLVNAGSIGSGVQIVSAFGGITHTVAADSAGRVHVWGGGNSGQLGLGDRNNAPLPTLSSTLSNIKSVTSGNYASYALNDSGQLYAWGGDQYGQVGIGGTGTSRPFVLSPLLINGIEDNVTNDITRKTVITYVGGGVGAIHILALDSDYNIYAWGNNSFGQLGDGGTNQTISQGNVKNVTAPRNITAYGAIGADSIPLSVRINNGVVDSDIIDPTIINFRTPAHAAGPVDLTVTNGSSSVTKKNAFNYIGATSSAPSDDGADEPPDTGSPPGPAERPIIVLPALPEKSTFTATDQNLGLSPSADKGYKLYMSSDNPTLRDVKNGNYINPIGATIDNPQQLSAATWGFALTRDSAPLGNGFDLSYDEQKESSKYAGVTREPTLIYASPTPTAKVRIYFGINAGDANKDIQNYTTTIVYTIISN